MKPCEPGAARALAPLASVVILALAACASDPKPVHIAVPVACISQVPERPTPLPQPVPDDARVALDLALAKLADWVGYGEKADAVMTACQ